MDFNKLNLYIFLRQNGIWRENEEEFQSNIKHNEDIKRMFIENKTNYKELKSLELTYDNFLRAEEKKKNSFYNRNTAKNIFNSLKFTASSMQEIGRVIKYGPIYLMTMASTGLYCMIDDYFNNPNQSIPQTSSTRKKPYTDKNIIKYFLTDIDDNDINYFEKYKLQILKKIGRYDCNNHYELIEQISEKLEPEHWYSCLIEQYRNSKKYNREIEKNMITLFKNVIKNKRKLSKEEKEWLLSLYL